MSNRKSRKYLTVQYLTAVFVGGICGLFLGAPKPEEWSSLAVSFCIMAVAIVVIVYFVADDEEEHRSIGDSDDPWGDLLDRMGD